MAGHSYLPESESEPSEPVAQREPLASPTFEPAEVAKTQPAATTQIGIQEPEPSAPAIGVAELDADILQPLEPKNVYANNDWCRTVAKTRTTVEKQRRPGRMGVNEQRSQRWEG